MAGRGLSFPVLPAGLSRLPDAAATAWADSLPGAAAACAETWGLRLGRVLSVGHVSVAIGATTRDGAPAVLKMQMPELFANHEAAALQIWGGRGAVRLIAHDPERGGLLLERCLPGKPISGSAKEVVGAMVGLLARLWVPAGAPFRNVSALVSDWTAGAPGARGLPEAELPRRLLDAALDLLPSLARSQGDMALCHHDLHRRNVLTATREPYLAIDPKPLVGEREFAAAEIVDLIELGHSRRAVLWRLDMVCDMLALDRERTRAWGASLPVAWQLNFPPRPEHIEMAQWLLSARP